MILNRWLTVRHRSCSIRRAFVATAVALTLLLVACGGGDSASQDDPAGSGGIEVVSAFYPLHDAAEGVGGERVRAQSLTPVGQGPHDLELGADQVDALAAADVVFYLGRGFQPQVEDALEGVGDGVVAVDLLDHVETLTVDPQLDGTVGEVDGEVLDGDVDPHVWLDPGRMIAIVETMVDTLTEVDPEGADGYRAEADAYLPSLEGLDGEYEAALETCASRVIVTSHRAFGYLADRYDLRQIPIAGISPEVEPDAGTLEAVAEEAEAEGVTTIFLETLAPPDLAETVAAEVGAELSLLDPVEGVTADQLDEGATYASIMGENLDRLVEGLSCT